jgi:peptide/nickel transport system substrate-binding protein
MEPSLRKGGGKMRKIIPIMIMLICSLSISLSTADAKEMIIAIAEEIEGTDVQQVGWCNVVHEMLYDRLVRFNRKSMTQLIPGFASDWSISQDGLQMRFTIPQGLAFSNGEPLNPEAIKRSFQRYLEVSPYASDLSNLKHIAAKGNELIMDWKKPPVPVFTVLSSRFGGIVDANAAAKLPKDAFNRKAIAFGPMVVEQWVQGSHITLKRNPAYRTSNPELKNQGPLKVEKVTVRFIPDSFTRVTEIQAGNVDMIWNVPTENVSDLNADKNITLHRALQPGSIFIYVNSEKPGLDDPKVRQALQRGVNRAELVAFLDNAAEARHGLMSAAMAGYSEAAESEFAQKFGYDFAAAAALLEQAGWKDSDEDGIRDKNGHKLSMTLMVSMDYPAAKKMAPLLQAQYKKLGIDLNLREYEAKYIKQAIREKNYDLGMRKFRWPDGDMLTYLYHTKSKTCSFPDIDQAIDEGRYELDAAKRAQCFAKAQALILEKGIAVPLVSIYRYVAVRSNVTGFAMNMDGTAVVNDLDKL